MLKPSSFSSLIALPLASSSYVLPALVAWLLMQQEVVVIANPVTASNLASCANSLGTTVTNCKVTTMQPNLLQQYGDLNYNYYNTFTSTVYEQIKSQEIKQRFLKNVPKSDGISYNYSNIPITIMSDTIASRDNGKVIEYLGNVTLQQGDRKLKAAKIVYRKLLSGDQVLEITNDLHLQNNQVYLNAKQVVINLQQKTSKIKDSDFEIVDTILHGTAKDITIHNNLIELKHAKVYAGPIKPFSLNVDSDYAVIDTKQQSIKFRQAFFKIGKLPLAYLGSYKLGFAKERKSGFLEPKIEISNNQPLKVSLPYYWNANNNLYWLFTTNYAVGDQLLFKNYIDYLWSLGDTRISVDVAPGFLNKNQINTWYYLGLSHFATYKQDYHLSFNYRYVSDKRYFARFYHNDSQAYLPSDVNLWYSKGNWDWSVRTYTFAPINSTKVSTYNVLPEVNYSYSQPFAYSKPIFNSSGQVAQFYNLDSPFKYTTRFYTQNSLSYTQLNKYLISNVKFNYYITSYRQFDYQINDYQLLTRLTPEVSAKLLTKFRENELVAQRYRLDYNLSLAYILRKSNHQKDSRFTVYDSSLLQPSVINLREGNYTTGIDRLNNLNQVVLGYGMEVTDSLTGRNRLDLNLGIVQSLDNITANYNKTTFTRKRDLIGEFHFNFNQDFNLDASGILDLSNKSSSMFITSFNYQPNLTNIVQLNYRHVSKQYFLDNLIGYKDKDLHQVGIATIWDLNPNLSMLSSNYFDTSTGQLVDFNLALNYSYYGWSLSTRYEHKRVGDERYENSFNVIVSLLGFSDNYNNRFGRYINSGAIPFVGNR